MTTLSLVEPAAPIEVRVYRHATLMAREYCRSEEAAAAVVERWSDVASIIVVADGPSTGRPVGRLGTTSGREAAEEPQTPLASRPLPGVGTE
jgi:hypothetical protein